ncbi:MAG: hypothetical protein MPK62_02685 [Alphaproteobacteria bacterium]|nr:hypothetical protein [Alphaproteobacteria bacterium]
MVETMVGGRPATITREGGNIRIVFHPILKSAKNPKAKMFNLTLSKADLETLKKAF